MSDQQRAANSSSQDTVTEGQRSPDERQRTADSETYARSQRPFYSRGWIGTVQFTNLLLFILLGLLVVIIVLFLVDALPNRRVPAAVRTPILANLTPTGEVLGGALPEAPDQMSDAVVIPTLGPAPAVSLEVAPRFRAFYDTHGGLRILGLPISEPMQVNGREIQWFERARLEHWPEFAGTPYEIQLGRLGVEYTQGRMFPTQTFFPSRPGLRYFPETEHGVGEPFLSFWEQNGGLAVFGYPISEAFDERLADGNVYRVQYFERARLEHHPEHAGTPYEVQVGLLGRALYLNERRPESIPPSPTLMPLP